MDNKYFLGLGVKYVFRRILLSMRRAFRFGIHRVFLDYLYIDLRNEKMEENIRQKKDEGVLQIVEKQ